MHFGSCKILCSCYTFRKLNGGKDEKNSFFTIYIDDDNEPVNGWLSK